MNRLFSILLVTIFVVGAVLPCAAQKPAPIRFGVTLGLTGRFAGITPMQRHGFELWRDHVNAAGGILGRQVELIIKDDQSDPVIAAKLYAEMIIGHEVDLLFGPYSSTLSAAVIPVCERHGFPLLLTGANADGLWQRGYDNVFGLWIPASRYNAGFLELLVLSGIERIAIVSAADAFSKTMHEGTVKSARRYGLTITSQHNLGQGEADPAPYAQQARQSGAQALLMCGYLSEAIAMRHALDATDWTPRAFYASVGPALPAYRDALGDMADHTFTSSHWEPSLQQPESAEFTSAFRARHSSPPSNHAATAYAGGQIFAKAITRAGMLDRAVIRNILSAMDMHTVIGRYGVDKKGQQIRHTPVVVQWQAGKKVIVWPKECATGAAVLR